MEEKREEHARAGPRPGESAKALAGEEREERGEKESVPMLPVHPDFLSDTGVVVSLEPPGEDTETAPRNMVIDESLKAQIRRAAEDAKTAVRAAAERAPLEDTLAHRIGWITQRMRDAARAASQIEEEAYETGIRIAENLNIRLSSEGSLAIYNGLLEAYARAVREGVPVRDVDKLIDYIPLERIKAAVAAKRGDEKRVASMLGGEKVEVLARAIKGAMKRDPELRRIMEVAFKHIHLSVLTIARGGDDTEAFTSYKHAIRLNGIINAVAARAIFYRSLSIDRYEEKVGEALKDLTGIMAETNILQRVLEDQKYVEGRLAEITGRGYGRGERNQRHAREQLAFE